MNDENSKKSGNDSPWEEPSLEQWIERMLREGYTEIVKYVVDNLPESSKEKYREIFKRVRAEKNKL